MTVEQVLALPERPEPPEDLTPEEAREWKKIVATKPADWFMRDTQPVLISLCQAICMAKKLNTLWQERPEDLKLVAAINKTSGQIKSLSAALRLTNQSRYTPQSAATASKRPEGQRLWQKQ